MAVAISLLFAAGSAWAVAPSYVLTDLGLGQANAINSAGQVAGTSSATGSDRAYLYYAGTTADLGTLGGTISRALGINTGGQVVGGSTNASAYHAFLYDGTMHDLGTLDGGGVNSSANAINDSGLVVGYAYTSAGYPHAFMYDSSMHDLGTLGGLYSSARAVNAGGTMVGYSYNSAGAQRAFLYTGGSMTDLGILAGATYSEAWGINASGQVVGDSNYGGGPASVFLYDGTMHNLGRLSGFADTLGYGINATGQIVGTAVNGTTYHAFLYTQGTMADLNSLVTNLDGWTLESASAINDSGAIVGYGLLGGNTRGFLLTPVPEPSTLVLVLLGAIGLGLYGWRRGVRRFSAFAAMAVVLLAAACPAVRKTSTGAPTPATATCRPETTSRPFGTRVRAARAGPSPPSVPSRPTTTSPTISRIPPWIFPSSTWSATARRATPSMAAGKTWR